MVDPRTLQTYLSLINFLDISIFLINDSQEDAIDFYAAEEDRLKEEVDNERAAALRKPLGIVFVTFASAEDAKKTYQDFQGGCNCGNNVANSSLSQQLKPQQWQVSFAPSRTDIFW